jgi:hypothetical protein
MLRSEVLSAVNINITVFRVVTTCTFGITDYDIISHPRLYGQGILSRFMFIFTKLCAYDQ